MREWTIEWIPRTFRIAAQTPELRARPHRKLPYRVLMERRLDGLRYHESFGVEGPAGPVPLPAGRLDWVDWDRAGRLVVLHAGRVDVAEMTADGPGELRTLIDLSADTPEPRETPPHARA